MKIYIVGYMGAGKSRFGRMLAERLDVPFFDLDEVFEQRYKISIMDFFDKYGEEMFRRLEYHVLLDSAAMDDCVISTGGGAPCFFDSMEFIKQHGVSVYLEMSAGDLFVRLKSVKKKRPLIHGKSDDDLKLHIDTQLPERIKFYNRADFTLDALAPDEPKMTELIQKLKY
jgi:shikimate kinase